ncbi:MAG: hypothetical protein GX345_06550 [Clostridiales bacterium]|jgi:hypothetical protein|nr:hypothetical protein [Clostridiales bacterium]
MKDEGSLKDLAKTYMEAAKLQGDLIRQNRKKLAASKAALDYAETGRVNRLLLLLYRQRRELLEIADYLEHYYDPGQKRGSDLI